MKLMEPDQPLSQQASITQENVLVSASYTMSLNEKRLLVMALSKLNPLDNEVWKTGADLTVTAREWAKVFNIHQKNAYKLLKNAADQLYKRSVRIQGDHWKGKEIRWLSAKEYSQEDGYVTLGFGKELVYHISGLVDQFTSYKLLSVSGLKSVHSIRMYELAKQFVDEGWRYIKVVELREMFKLEKSYQTWQDFKKRVLDRSCKEVSEKSDLVISYATVKKGRNIHAVRIKVDTKEQLEMEL